MITIPNDMVAWSLAMTTSRHCSVRDTSEGLLEREPSVFQQSQESLGIIIIAMGTQYVHVCSRRPSPASTSTVAPAFSSQFRPALSAVCHRSTGSSSLLGDAKLAYSKRTALHDFDHRWAHATAADEILFQTQ